MVRADSDSQRRLNRAYWAGSSPAGRAGPPHALRRMARGSSESRGSGGGGGGGGARPIAEPARLGRCGASTIAAALTDPYPSLDSDPCLWVASVRNVPPDAPHHRAFPPRAAANELEPGTYRPGALRARQRSGSEKGPWGVGREGEEAKG